MRRPRFDEVALEEAVGAQEADNSEGRDRAKQLRGQGKAADLEGQHPNRKGNDAGREADQAENLLGCSPRRALVTSQQEQPHERADNCAKESDWKEMHLSPIFD